MKEAEAAEQKQAQEIKALEKQESSVLDEHRRVSTLRMNLQKDLDQVTEEAQTSRCVVCSQLIEVICAESAVSGTASGAKE